MEVTFSKNGDTYVGSFTVTSDFNIHIEKESDGDMCILHKGVAEGAYASTTFTTNYLRNKVFDYDFSALVYPKYIKVVSLVPVISCTVTVNDN